MLSTWGQESANPADSTLPICVNLDELLHVASLFCQLYNFEIITRLPSEVVSKTLVQNLIYPIQLNAKDLVYA